MKKIVCILCCLFLMFGCAEKNNKDLKEAGSNLKIIVATDLHYLADACHDGGLRSQEVYDARDGKVTEYGKEVIMAFVDTCIKENADAVLLTGDLTFNGEKKSHIELAQLLQPLKEANIEVMVMPGNHDIRNPFAYSFEGDKIYYVSTVETDEFVDIYQDYGYGDAYMRDENSLSYVYKISEDIWMMLIDANGYEWNSAFGLDSMGAIKAKTVEWMKTCFEKAEKAGATILMSTHHSLLENEYLHSEDYRIVSHALSAMDLMMEYGSYVNFSGHIHTQSIVSNVRNDVSLFDITTESLVVAGNNYGVITIVDHALKYEAKSLDVDSWAKESGQTDENLLNFHEYAWQHYYDVSYTHFLKNYESLDVPEEVKKDMADLLAYMNPYYFSGRMDEIRDEVLNSKQYKRLCEFSDQFSTRYLESMLIERELHQTSFEIAGIR